MEGIHARLDLKERHLAEISDAMKSLNPKDVLLAEYEVEAKRAADDAETFRKTTLEKMRRELEEKKEAARLREEEKKRQLADQLRWVSRTLPSLSCTSVI